MNRVDALIERLILPVLAVLLAFITAGVFLQVVLRYGFSRSFLWGEELSLFAFIWCVFLGAAICSWRRTHFAFELFEHVLRGRAGAAQRLVVDVAVLAVALVIVVEGWRFSQLSIARMSPALGITLLVPTVVIPLSGALMVLAALRDTVQDARRLWTGRS